MGPLLCVDGTAGSVRISISFSRAIRFLVISFPPSGNPGGQKLRMGIGISSSKETLLSYNFNTNFILPVS